MEMNNKVTRHKYGHRGLNEFNSVNESVAKREFYKNRLKKEEETILEAQTIRESEISKQATLLENINNRKINEIKMSKVKNVLHESILTKLVKVAFTEAFMESLYVDDNYKIDNSERLSTMVESFVDENGGYKLLENAVKQNKDSMLLKSIYEACKSKAEKITKERCKEAGDDPEKIDFDVRLDELDEFKEDLSKTNIDSLGEVVKDKVLNTVIEEKERSIKKQEFEEDIKNEVEGAVSESLKYKIHNKNVIEQPSLFSAIMRKNYSNMLEESVSIIQSYNPNDKLTEIGLDETEVDYNDKNEHSLTNIDKEKFVTTKSMKPDDSSDDFNNSGNVSFDNSALATLDEESDDIDMFSLTNESSAILYEDEEEIIQENSINIWEKFVNVNEDRTYTNNDDIEDILETFTNIETLTESDAKKPGFIEKAKAIIKKILDFFRSIKEKILSIFRKKVETINDKINEVSSDNSDGDDDTDNNQVEEEKESKKLGINSRHTGTLRTTRPSETSKDNDIEERKKLGTNSRHGGKLHKTRGYFIDFSPQDVIKNIREALTTIDAYSDAKTENSKLCDKLDDIIFNINRGNFYNDEKEISEYINMIEQSKIVSIQLEDAKEEEHLISIKEKDQILKDFSSTIASITKFIQAFSKDVEFIEGILKRFNNKKIDKTPENNVTLFIKAANKSKEIGQSCIVDATKLLDYAYKYLCRFKNTKVSYKESTDEIEEILESFTEVEILTETDANKPGFKEKVKNIIKKIIEFFKNLKDKILSLFKKKVKQSITDTKAEIKSSTNTTDDSKKISISFSGDMLDKYLTDCKKMALYNNKISDELLELSTQCTAMIHNVGGARSYDEIKDSINKIKEFINAPKFVKRPSEISEGERQSIIKKLLDVLEFVDDEIDECSLLMDEDINDGIKTQRELLTNANIPEDRINLKISIYSKHQTHCKNIVSELNKIYTVISSLKTELCGKSTDTVSESFMSVLDEDIEFIYESVLDEYESVLESEDEYEDMFVMESAIDSIEFDEDGILYEELLISDDFIKESVEKMDDKTLINHLPKLEKMIVDLNNELKIAKSGEIPALKSSQVSPIKKFFVKLNVKMNGLTPEKIAKNLQEMITIGKKEITFVKAELKKRGLKPVKESSMFISVLDEYEYLEENVITDVVEDEIDMESPEYIAMESIAKLGNDNNLRLDQRRRVVRLCESLSISELADLTSKYRNEAYFLNENITRLSNMNDMDKAVYVYEASLEQQGYNFNDELKELNSKITICNEQVGLFNIAAKILITLESLGLTEACKKGKKKSVCSECGEDLVDTKCKDCKTAVIDEEDERNDDVMEESVTQQQSAEVFMDKVLCESLIQYTLLEMMNTAKVIKYTNNDVKKMALELIR